MKKYGPEVFLHFDLEVEEDNPDSVENASFIIETGFNLYIVLSNYMEIQKDSEDMMIKGDDVEGK